MFIEHFSEGILKFELCWKLKFLEGSCGIVVRALASHQYGTGTPVFPSPQKPAFDQI